MMRPSSDSLNVPGRETVPARVQFSFDNRRVRHNCPVPLEDEMETAHCMVPVVVGEGVGVATPGGTEQLAKCCDLFRAQFVAPKSSHDRHKGENTFRN